MEYRDHHEHSKWPQGQWEVAEEEGHGPRSQRHHIGSVLEDGTLHGAESEKLNVKIMTGISKYLAESDRRDDVAGAVVKKSVRREERGKGGD